MATKPTFWVDPSHRGSIDGELSYHFGTFGPPLLAWMGGDTPQEVATTIVPRRTAGHARSVARYSIEINQYTSESEKRRSLDWPGFGTRVEVCSLSTLRPKTQWCAFLIWRNVRRMMLLRPICCPASQISIKTSAGNIINPVIWCLNDCIWQGVLLTQRIMSTTFWCLPTASTRSTYEFCHLNAVYCTSG